MCTKCSCFLLHALLFVLKKKDFSIIYHYLKNFKKCSEFCTKYDESLHNNKLPSLSVTLQASHTSKAWEKLLYNVMAGVRDLKGIGGVGVPHYLTSLILHSLWIRPTDNLLISSIKACSDSCLASRSKADSNRPWLTNHWKLLLMWCRHVCVLNNFQMAGECVRPVLRLLDFK